MTSKGKVAFHTLGCKLNFSETSAIARNLQQEGYTRTDDETSADVFVLNTCSVTENADKECRQIIRQINRKNPEAFVVVTGCYAQLKAEEIGKIDGVDLVLGAKEKFRLPFFLNNLSRKGVAEVHSCEIGETDFFVSAYSVSDRTRAFLKVQDGCDYTCSYCTIPLARGISRSDTIQNVVSNATEIAAKGIREIVLTGVNIGDYGKGEYGNKKHEHTFLELIHALDKVDGLSRLRISSIEPNLLKDEIIRFVSSSDKFVPHFHIPLQSGSDKILKLMRRRYLTGLYQERIATIRQLMPDACIGVDVITGFPGETDADFQETYDFLNSLDISYLHVFTYSERPNTDAIELAGTVSIPERQLRTKRLRVLSSKKKHVFYDRFLGQVRPALMETEVKNGMLQGYTDNYIRVTLPYSEDLVNRIVNVQLNSFDEEGCIVSTRAENMAKI